MTYSQINHAKAWGFSRRTPNLNQLITSNALRGVPLNENTPNDIQEQEGKPVFEYSIFGDPTGQTKIGDFSC